MECIFFCLCYLQVPWIQAKNQTIRVWSRSTTINGGGFHEICSRNKLECYDNRGLPFSCACHTVEKGSLRVDFDNPLDKEQHGPFFIALTAGDLVRVPPTQIGFVDATELGTLYI